MDPRDCDGGQWNNLRNAFCDAVVPLPFAKQQLLHHRDYSFHESQHGYSNFDLSVPTTLNTPRPDSCDFWAAPGYDWAVADMYLECSPFTNEQRIQQLSIPVATTTSSFDTKTSCLSPSMIVLDRPSSHLHHSPAISIETPDPSCGTADDACSFAGKSDCPLLISEGTTPMETAATPVSINVQDAEQQDFGGRPSDTVGDIPEDSDAGDTCYAQLLWRCLMSQPNHTLALSELYAWIARNSPKAHCSINRGWQNSVRHNLSMNAAFERVASGTGKKSSLWRLSLKAIKEGVCSTTRYRKDPKRATQKRASPALKRVLSGAKGGQATRRATLRKAAASTAHAPLVTQQSSIRQPRSAALCSTPARLWINPGQSLQPQKSGQPLGLNATADHLHVDCLTEDFAFQIRSPAGQQRHPQHFFPSTAVSDSTLMTGTDFCYDPFSNEMLAHYGTQNGLLPWYTQ